MNEVTNKQFTHLKIHTQYSICEGALKTSDLAKYCKTNKIRAMDYATRIIYVVRWSFQNLWQSPKRNQLLERKLILNVKA